MAAGRSTLCRLQLEFLGATTAIELLEATVLGHHVLEELQTHTEQAGEGRAAGGWSAAMASADTPWPPPRPAAGAPTRPPSARRRHSCSGLPSAVGSPSGRQAPNAPRVRRPHRTRVPPRQVGAHRRRAGRRRRVEAEESHRKGGISRVGAQKEGFFLLFSFFAVGGCVGRFFFYLIWVGPTGTGGG